MNVHISYKVHKTPDIEKEISHQLEKLQKRLQVFRPELVQLKGTVDESSARKGFAVSLNLHLPSGQMAAECSAPNAMSALKAAFDDLLQQLNKHKAMLRSSHKWPRRRGGGQGRPEPSVPFEQTLAAIQTPVVSSDDIRSYVNANLRRLERFVEHELYFREVADQISPNSVTKEEVIDEAIARALGDGMEKPERLTLEPWLYRLAIQVLEELCSRSNVPTEDVPLEESVRPRNVKASDEPELQFHQPDETLTGESVIADKRVATPEDIASTDEMLALVQFALKDSSATDREAFILHTLEGFSPDEIAAITDRSPEQVSSSIASAREHLHRSPLMANRFRNKPSKEARTI